MKHLLSSQAPSTRLVVAVLLSAAGACYAQSQFFTDPTMTLDDYSVTTFRQTGTVTIDNTATGGNPGSALSVQYATPATPPFTTDLSSNTFIANTFSIDPAAFAPGYTISLEIDKKRTITPSTVSGLNAQGFLISQGGQLFLHAVPLSNEPDIFLTGSFTSSDAADFSLFQASGVVDSSVHPNFDAGPMQFGFTSSLFVPDRFPAIQGLMIYDNFKVSVVSPIPEPSEWALMGAGLSVIGLIARRQRKRLS